MSTAKKYIQSHTDRFLSELFNFLRIPSVSADPQHKEDMYKAAKYVATRLQEAGAGAVQIHETAGHPIVYGEKKMGDTLPTVLVYGHYDVQPPDPMDLWVSPPFEPVIRQGKIFARGACDDKGQVYMHIKALEVIQALNCTTCNIKFLIEGEEETGSTHIKEFMKKNASLLKADVVVVSDTAMLAPDQPSITVGLRGISCMEVELTGPNRDLHSGVYGGAVANPIQMLCGMVRALIDEKGRITVPGFYDHVREYSTAERLAMQIDIDEKAYMSDLGVRATKGEEGYGIAERVGIRPSLDVNGIWGGYQGEGIKTVLPSKAYAKISMRLVPDQKSESVARCFTQYLKSMAPPQSKIKITSYHGAEPALMSTNSDAYRAACQAFKTVWGKSPVPTYDGGSIPIVSLFKAELGLDTILMGFGLNSNAIHSPNEHYEVKNFLLGIETILSFYEYLAKPAVTHKRI